MKHMYFDPDSFGRIYESIALNKRKCKLPVIDTFTLYMLLQLHVKRNNWSSEHSVAMSELRHVFSKTNDMRKDKDIIYFLEILQCANMVTFDIKGKAKLCEVFFKMKEIVPVKPTTVDECETRKRVTISKCNRHLIEDYKSNVPFAIYCLLRSLQRREDGMVYKVKISFKEISERLGNISGQTVAIHKKTLEDEGWIWTSIGGLYESDGKPKRECNEYVIYDYKHRLQPEKIKLFRLQKGKWKAQKGTVGRAEKNILSDPIQTADIGVSALDNF